MLKSFFRKQDSFASVELVVLTCLALWLSAFIVDAAKAYADVLAAQIVGAHGSSQVINPHRQ
ncbi:hypothetical protein KBY27_16810 [Ruegeria pomeroyi]|uniref:Uncharacterized protein n=1 Tax=Ruegeria pomeroyi TaxID=89184 RepID=A0A9Q3WNV4_9RHOB|nr:hypothetical protein [Ruegeria pomeroyi]MCE8539119.1 hypothetical protein [Ruegeria pomeroyi]